MVNGLFCGLEVDHVFLAGFDFEVKEAVRAFRLRFWPSFLVSTVCLLCTSVAHWCAQDSGKTTPEHISAWDHLV